MIYPIPSKKKRSSIMWCFQTGLLLCKKKAHDLLRTQKFFPFHATMTAFAPSKKKKKKSATLKRSSPVTLPKNKTIYFFFYCVAYKRQSINLPWPNQNDR